MAVTTCNEAGKTSEIIPLLGLSLMAAFPGATVFSTAGTEQQIRDQLFDYLEAKCRPYANWVVSRAALTVRAPAIDGLSSQWVGRVPREALTMEGLHNHWEADRHGRPRFCPLMIIYDEAKSLGQPMFDAAWRMNPAFFLAISTPGDSAGPLYEAIDPDRLKLKGLV